MDPGELKAYNESFIADFRTNRGQVDGPVPTLLLHTIGARSGHERVHPLSYLRHDGRPFVFAAALGADHHPAWYHNLRANPHVEAELGTETIGFTAVQLVGEEGDRVFAEQVSRLPVLREYANSTSRVIPVVELVRPNSRQYGPSAHDDVDD